MKVNCLSTAVGLAGAKGAWAQVTRAEEWGMGMEASPRRVRFGAC
jgi:hypothetical protein